MCDGEHARPISIQIEAKLSSESGKDNLTATFRMSLISTVRISITRRCATRLVETVVTMLASMTRHRARWPICKSKMPRLSRNIPSRRGCFQMIVEDIRD